MVIGLLALASIPTVIGVAEGVSQQRQQNDKKADAKRMGKFHIDVYCDAKSRSTKYVHGRKVVLRDDRVWIDEHAPNLRARPAYTAKAFYIQYPDEERSPAPMGLVSQVRDDPPLLNWIYVDKDTYELRYGNRSASYEHHVGPWDWTEEDETGVTFDGREGFMAVEDKRTGEWQVYFDRDDDNLKGKLPKERKRLQISLERKILEGEDANTI